MSLLRVRGDPLRRDAGDLDRDAERFVDMVETESELDIDSERDFLRDLSCLSRLCLLFAVELVSSLGLIFVLECQDHDGER